MKTNTWKKLLRARRSKKAKRSIEQSEKVLNRKEDERTSSKSTLDNEVRDEQISFESREKTSVKENIVEENAADEIPGEESTGADMQEIEDKLDDENIETSIDDTCSCTRNEQEETTQQASCMQYDLMCESFSNLFPKTEKEQKNLNEEKLREFHQTFAELIDGYNDDYGAYIDMSQPREASYYAGEKRDEETKESIKVYTRLGEDVPLQSSNPSLISKFKMQMSNTFDPYSYRPIKAEYRAITLRQLKAVAANVKRRCQEEHWKRERYNDNGPTGEFEPVTYETANLYDVCKHIIMPFTEYSQKSFVETLPSTAGTQLPRWFMSHFWGNPLVDTIACLEQMISDFDNNYNPRDDARGGGMTQDTPIWICSFGNNQHNIQSELNTHPAQSPFAKALQLCNHRTVSILDVSSKVYTRLWAVYELHKTLMESESEGILAVYTTKEHTLCLHRGLIKQKRRAIGLVDGGVTNDAPGREDHFPIDRILKSVQVEIEKANASMKEDERNIKNAIVGIQGIENEEPPETHENYDKLNRAVRGAFASSIPCIVGAHKNGVETWDKVLSAIYNGMTKSMTLDFARTKLSDLNAEACADLFRHLPKGLEELNIGNCPFQRVAMDALLDWLENPDTNLKKLHIRSTCIGGSSDGMECGIRLANILARDNCQLEGMALSHTDLIGSRNVNVWINSLRQNQSLQDYFNLEVMNSLVQQVKETNINVLMDPPKNRWGVGSVGKINWNGSTFPDATLSEAEMEQLQAVSRTVFHAK